MKGNEQPTDFHHCLVRLELHRQGPLASAITRQTIGIFFGEPRSLRRVLLSAALVARNGGTGGRITKNPVDVPIGKDYTGRYNEIASGASTIISAVEKIRDNRIMGMVDRPGAACIGDVNDYC